MNENMPPEPLFWHKSYGYSLLSFLFIGLCGLLLSNFLAQLAALPFVSFDFSLLKDLIANPQNYENSRLLVMLVQTVSALGTFVLAPLFFLRYWDRTETPLAISFGNFNPLLVTLTVLIMLVVMPFGSVVVQWNENLNLPDFLQGFETWAKDKEVYFKNLTLYLVDFESDWQFLIGILVIAVLPAIGEELVFRGIVQHKLSKLLGNVHGAIWLTGFIFSAIHFQFYGLVPRMLLGVLFGYLYYWSGNLALPMLAHFVNNAFTLSMMYWYKTQLENTQLNMSAESAPFWLVMFSIAFTVAMLWKFRRVGQQQLG